MRIVLLGVAGAGKSTVAQELSEALQIPTFSLDDWAPPGQPIPDLPSFRQKVEEEHQGEAWISDGNFAAATFDIRLPRATHIVWLEVPRSLAILRAVKRALEPGGVHTLRGLGSVIRFILRFDRVNRPLILSHIQKWGPQLPLISHHTRAPLEELLQKLREARP